MKNICHGQKGFTLIELLAVVVILGIISAIAVPSVGGIIDNTKKDAHVANAKQMIAAARLAVVGDPALQPKAGNEVILSLKDLEDKGYIEHMEDPDGGDYWPGGSGNTIGSFVQVTKDSGSPNFIYKVRLTNGTRSIGTESDPLEANEITRDSVQSK